MGKRGRVIAIVEPDTIFIFLNNLKAKGQEGTPRDNTDKVFVFQPSPSYRPIVRGEVG